jgi:hypothetical protein
VDVQILAKQRDAVKQSLEKPSAAKQTPGRAYI